MADTATPATAEVTGTPTSGDAGAATAPDLTALQQQLAQAEIARKAAEALAQQKAAEAAKNAERYANLERSHGKLAQEVGTLRRQVPNATMDDGPGSAQQPDQSELMNSLALLTAFRTDPRYMTDYYANAAEVEKVIENDPSLQQLDVFTRHVAALNAVKASKAAEAAAAKDAANEATAKELAEAKAKLAKLETSRQTLAGQAFVSGTGAALPPENINLDEFRNMDPDKAIEEMERRFGKQALLGNLT